MNGDKYETALPKGNEMTGSDYQDIGGLQRLDSIKLKPRTQSEREDYDDRMTKSPINARYDINDEEKRYRPPQVPKDEMNENVILFNKIEDDPRL